jgi:DNA-3-methyladenine glycosylase II
MLRRAALHLPGLKPQLIKVGPGQPLEVLRSSLPLYLCRSVVGQQLSGKAAMSIWARVEEHCSSSKRSLEQLVREEGHEWLRTCGVSGSKSRAIAEIFIAKERGILDVTTLSRLDHENRSTQVSQIWGVGQWTCDMLSMFYFGDPDVWPNSDTAATRVLTAFIQQDRLEVTALEMAEKFRPYRSYLARYLWRISDMRNS